MVRTCWRPGRGQAADVFAFASGCADQRIEIDRCARCSPRRRSSEMKRLLVGVIGDDPGAVRRPDRRAAAPGERDHALPRLSASRVEAGSATRQVGGTSSVASQAEAAGLLRPNSPAGGRHRPSVSTRPRRRETPSAGAAPDARPVRAADLRELRPVFPASTCSGNFQGSSLRHRDPKKRG